MDFEGISCINSPVGREHKESILLAGRIVVFSEDKRCHNSLESTVKKWCEKVNTLNLNILCLILVHAFSSTAVVVASSGLVYYGSALPDMFCSLINTLPLRFSLPLLSVTDLPRLKMDFHFLDFPDNLRLQSGDEVYK